MIEKILEKIEELTTFSHPFINEKLVCKNDVLAIVQEVAKEGPWVLCSERLPEENKLVLIYAESTARGGSIRCVAELRNGFWFAQIASDTLGLTGIGQYNVIKWAELPEV